MKPSKAFTLLASHWLFLFPAQAGEDTVARDLVREAAVAKIIENSSKGGLTPRRLSRPGSWRFAVSPSLSYQYFGKVRLNAGGRNTSTGLPNLVGAGSLTLPDIGDGVSQGDRTYEDGFVNLTGPTADTGRTWFWGYDNASQIDGSGNLIMNATGTRRDFREIYQDFGNLSARESLTSLVPRLDFTLAPPAEAKLPFKGILVSLAYFADESRGEFVSFSGQQTLEEYRLDFRDTFETSNLILPAPGYGGSLAGPGVTIPNPPAQRETTETLTGTDIATLRNVVSLDLDLSNFSLAIGPTFEGSFARDWPWQASFGPTLNFYRYTFRQSEQVYGTMYGTTTPVGPRSRDNESGSEFGIGLFLRGSVARQLTESWQITSYLQAEYAESFRISNGISSFKVEPAGYSIGLGVNHTF